jgi:hypothetical protein
MTMADLEMMRDILKMHCLLRQDGWECDTMGENKCAECLAKHLINHGVNVRPAVPGCDNQYTIAEMAFHNGESRMKERMVDMLLGMQVTAKSEEHSQLREILQRVREL